MSQSSGRKIVHIDMDAFYASVEQRDQPELRNRPVVVAWQSRRSVVCAASYEARRFGVHSAMPAARAERLCPHAVFVPPDFPRYRAVSQQIRAIFRRHTDLIEPLSLDEAYLDVTRNKTRLPTATRVAQAIRAAIRDELSLNASAGVAPNKFLAKIASDWRKPNGLFVIQPHEVHDFLSLLAVRKLPGVGKATQEALERLGIQTVADLRAQAPGALARRFGKFGTRLAELAEGIDERPVDPRQTRRSLSTETTFEDDRALDTLTVPLEALAERVWQALARESRRPQTIFIKLKTSDFRNLTRSQTLSAPPASAAQLLETAKTLLSRIELPVSTRYRLLGVGLSNFYDPSDDGPQAELFSAD